MSLAPPNSERERERDGDDDDEGHKDWCGTPGFMINFFSFLFDAALTA